jgi:predicted O-linked N-acetylglucosamine transferase (SPINDLY family)
MNLDQLLETGAEHHRAGRLGEAEVIYRQILSQDPDYADALHLLGVLAHQIGRHGDAIDLIRRAISLRPDAAPYYGNWAIALAAAGRLSDAIAAQRHAVTLDPSSAEAHNNLARSLLLDGRNAEAAAELRSALALKADDPEILANLSNVLRVTGELDQAVSCARRAIAIRPDLIAAYNNLGAALHLQGLFDQAIDTYHRALAVRSSGPDIADIEHNLGIALQRAGRWDEAIDALTRATRVNSGRGETFHQLSFALRERGRLDEAVAAARRAIEIDPNHAEAHNNLGIIFSEKGQVDEAAAEYRKAIALRPDFGGAYNNLGNALKDMGDLEGAVNFYRQAAALDSQTSVAENYLYSIHFHPGYDARRIALEHADWNARFAKPLAARVPPHTNDRNPDRRLRIGYVSLDLREHPVGRFLLPLLANHDHEQFEIFCYTDLARPDAVTERLKQSSDVWRPTAKLTDEALAQLVRNDRIDILVDLAMHMDGTRMLAFARKPAPVQVTYLAYVSTTGLETIDYRLTDPYLDPPGIDESIYSEKSIRLPHTYWCYQPPASAPPVAPLPSASNGHITFGSLNNFSKVSRSALRAWIEILKQVPSSRLIFHAGEGAHRQRVLREFLDGGIFPDRVEFVARLPIEQYLHAYDRIDIALDPFPYTGGTTTCDALYMGTPVVTLAGPTAFARGGVSLLSNIGLPELIAENSDRYIRIVTELASNPSRLTELRTTLRDRMTRSPLMNAPQFARDVEHAYRTMWRAWCISGK